MVEFNPGFDKERVESIGKDIDELCKKHNINYEDFIYVQAALARLDAEKQEHELVKSLLYSMAENFGEAAFNFYASFK